MENKDLIEKINDIPKEYWDSISADLESKNKRLDELCASGNHQGWLSNPIFSGDDIWWKCSRCGKRVLDINGNKPFKNINPNL